MNLVVYEGLFAICRLAQDAELPQWGTSSDFICVTRSPDELSIVCPQQDVPSGVRCSRDWRLMRIEGVLDLQMTGVLSSLLTPLAEAGVNVFVMGTFDTDYVMVPERLLDRAVSLLKAEGHHIV